MNFSSSAFAKAALNTLRRTFTKLRWATSARQVSPPAFFNGSAKAKTLRQPNTLNNEVRGWSPPPLLCQLLLFPSDP